MTRIKLMTKNIICSGSMWMIGDFVAQQVKTKKINKRRSVCNFIYGGFFVAPLGTVWYRTLDNHVLRLCDFKRNACFVSLKVLLESMLWSPFIIASYILVSELINNKSLNQIRHTFRKSYIPSILFESTYWPLLDTYNFKFVHVSNQLMFMNTFTLLNTIILSMIVNHN